MLVCFCNGVSDRKIRRLVREGAFSGREVARACGAGASCGSCRRAVYALVEETLSELDTSPSEAAGAYSPNSVAPSPA